ncbi:hypothetical protein [Streptomyces termitum]|uniref:hypothetical protein n=1 Tax=Streptomyces termitum TaxID=67368 RepID=UPI00378B5E51
MTMSDGGITAVRARLAPGRLLPLGTAADGAWLAERAAREVLLRAASAVRGVVPGPLRIGPGAEAAGPPPEGVPPGGLPPGPLRIAAEFAAVSGRPLPAAAGELREVLHAAAEGLDLAVAEVDLRVTELLDAAPAGEPAPAAPEPGRTAPATDDPVALAALRVPGVAGIADALGPPVHRMPGAVRVECAVTAGRRPVEVARAVRAAVAEAVPEGTSVTVLVSELR